jgi:8-oxo-dGTP pyrophosphatase MutT (NUDIX family)
VRVQYGALPYRITEAGTLEVLLITSRTRRRWIIPKGWPIKGRKPAKSAAREAYEEAGVRGTTSAKPIGRFVYDKIRDEDGRAVPCEVVVFGLKVKRQLTTWPEAKERELRWLSPADAEALTDEDGLRPLIVALASKKAPL